MYKKYYSLGGMEIRNTAPVVNYPISIILYLISLFRDNYF